MNQLNSEEQIKYGNCVRCKQVNKDNKERYCKDCHLKNKEEKFGRCVECKQIITGKDWCQTCNSNRFKKNFDNWTSGNDNIDKFIQNTQLSAKNYSQILEWIPYDRFSKVIYIAEGGFGKVHRANWKDGYISHWDACKNQWNRHCANRFVALKSLNNSQNATLEFISEITLHLKIHEYKSSQQIIQCHGITQDPNTKEYIMVMHYATNGNLRNSLIKKKKTLYKMYGNESNLDLSLRIWKYKIKILFCISSALRRIHGKKLIHRDLHIGNIVCDDSTPRITDMGLCKPANYNELENGENNIFGVLSYVAPEILRGNNYTKASDIYSFGIIMYELISESSPYHNNAHDQLLALSICEGLRPEFKTKVPKSILHLIKRCLDANPSDRPDARELTRIFYEWESHFNDDDKSELINQIEEVETINNNSSTNDSFLADKIHPEAIYTSRLLNFKNLPEPKNSDDYYKMYDNISSKKNSEIILKSDDIDHEECAIPD